MSQGVIQGSMREAPLPDSELAKTSAKWASADLNPTVLAFAMLLPITSSALDEVLSPLKPC